jgi:hypothetical protein
MLRVSVLLAAAAGAEAFAPGSALPSTTRSVAVTQGISMQRLGSSRSSGGSTPFPVGTQPVKQGSMGGVGSMFGKPTPAKAAAPAGSGRQGSRSISKGD